MYIYSVTPLLDSNQGPMKELCSCIRACRCKPLATILLLLLLSSVSQCLTNPDATLGPHTVCAREDQDHTDTKMGNYATASSLPDCSHACGPCSPCKRVTVSFECSVAESCPVVYRCMCRGRCYQVPSN